MRRALLRSLLFPLVTAPTASAEVRLVDSATGASRAVLRDDPTEPDTENAHLIRFADDATVLVRRRGRALRIGIGIGDGNVRRVPWLDKAEAVGPGGRSIHLRYGDEPRVTLRAADGRRLASYDYQGSDWEPSVAWTRDGTRVAFARPPVLKVLDTATGQVVMDRLVSDDFEFGTTAWSPDGSALVVTDGPKLLRLDVPAGVTTELDRAGSDTTLSASWGETGRIVVNDGMRVRILGNPQLTVRTGSDRLSGVSWSLSGSALVFFYSGPLDDCVFPNEGFAALVPGQKRRVLIRPSHRQIVRYAESPDGRFLAVDLKPGESREPERRGKRRRWPTRVERDYGTGSHRADAALRRVILRAARAVRRGASRHRTLIGVRLGVGRVEARYSGISDSAVGEVIADEVDGWLTAAGLHGVDALDEISCD